MNSHAKRARDAIIALGFNLDEDASRNGKDCYWHPSSPDERLKVWAGMSEGASRAVSDKARQIAGLGAVERKTIGAIRENARVRRQGERQRDYERRLREEQALAPYQAAADVRAKRMSAAREIAEREQARREIEDLMRPGRATP